MSAVRVEAHTGSRASLRSLFELAEDSAAQLDGYIDEGRVLVAMAGEAVVGRPQFVETAPGEAKLKNRAVLESRQGQGIGRLLVAAAIESLRAERVRRLLVATAAADI